ncbi:MAG: hypothetical protein F6J93_13275 [Oscillatoria sp. SIO1A7]|nr:hypothetical protein [Oscillatoria sp. SIO1A7]
MFLKYCSLQERLSDGQLEMVRKSSVDILSSLASSHEGFIWFVSGLKLVEEPDEAKGYFEYPEEYYTIDACCDRMSINGRVSIFELSRDDLEYYSQMLGNFDAVSGIAIEPGRMADVLSVLSLTEPIPSSQRGYLVETVSYKSLIAVLELGSFFFEELDNGTRLRLVGKKLDRHNMISNIEKYIAKISQTRVA